MSGPYKKTLFLFWIQGFYFINNLELLTVGLSAVRFCVTESPVLLLIKVTKDEDMYKSLDLFAKMGLLLISEQKVENIFGSQHSRKPNVLCRPMMCRTKVDYITHSPAVFVFFEGLY